MTDLPGLDRASLAAAVAKLCRREHRLAAVVNRFGVPPLWKRKAGFASLVHIILEQQVSLTSAQAVFLRLRQAITPFSPAKVLAAPEQVLITAGLTRQKRRYCRTLAEAIDGGDLRLGRLAGLSDQAVTEQLTAITGIGRWTSDIYLLMVLCRPDIWPRGDRALVVAAREVLKLNVDPDADQFQVLGASWRPFRAAAARILWHYYLKTR